MSHEVLSKEGFPRELRNRFPHDHIHNGTQHLYMNLLRRIRTRLLAQSALTFAGGMLLALATPGSSYAQEGSTVKSIDVQYVGNQTVSPDRIRSSMSTRVGDKFSYAKIDEDVKSLYASGDIEKVKMLTDSVSGGVALIVVVQTRALYGGTEITGNTLIDDNKLAKKVDLSVNKPIDAGALETARTEMQEMYRKKGFSEATVTYRIGAPTAEGYSKVYYMV